jgi:hypothetical protein
MKYYLEWCSKLADRCGRLVLSTNLPEIFKRVHDTGYTGLYLFKEEDALEIIASKSSAGLAQYSVSSSRLLIDIDEGVEGLRAAEAKLEGFGYEVWSSGGKGFHIILKHEFMTSSDLPYSHRKWVEEQGIECDLSLYHPGHIVSAPGRIHPRTKQRKQFVKKIEGSMIAVKLVKKPEVVFSFSDTGEELSRALMRLTDLSSSEPKPGNRHVSLWGTSKALAQAGVSFDTATELLRKVNEGWKNQKSEEELMAAIQQGYKHG